MSGAACYCGTCQQADAADRARLDVEALIERLSAHDDASADSLLADWYRGALSTAEACDVAEALLEPYEDL